MKYYVDRNGSNDVVGLYKHEQSLGQERLDETHPDVVAFKNAKTAIKALVEKEGEITSNSIDLFRMILAIYNVGVTKGLWTKADFDAEEPGIIAKGIQWKQLLNELDNM